MFTEIGGLEDIVGIYPDKSRIMKHQPSALDKMFTERLVATFCCNYENLGPVTYTVKSKQQVSSNNHSGDENNI